MKFIPSFSEYESVSEGLQYHINNNLDLQNSIYRLGSDAYINLFEEVKQYWDAGNIILKSPSAWMAKNLQVGAKAVYNDRKTGKQINVKLDLPARGGNKKYIVYRDSGKKIDDNVIIAKKIEWGDPNLSVKNGNPGAAASFWARHRCDKIEKMDPNKAGFWACYSPSLFSTELGLASDEPW